MRFLPRKRGTYTGVVVFGQDGWHYPDGKVGSIRHRLVAVPSAEPIGPDFLAAETTWRYARATDRNHNAIYERRIVELGSPESPIVATVNVPDGGPR